MTLPDQSNLVRWVKSTKKTCYICGKAVGTAKHLLVGCKVLLDSGQYSRRHNRVLEVIREVVSLSVARAKKEITTNERSVGFVREGTRATKSNVKPYSILKAASDWAIMMDTFVRGRGGTERYKAKSLYNVLKDLGLSRTHINALLERTSKAAQVGSFQIWLGRERSLDSGGERITRVS
ncbi:unnamed protein product [Danaus chrysippus]|uniref:(African queen) hypothetical protein n=1 Tax=Danaus chrysippus TaxID=151541 RepID=A0A8J2QJ69_9NEOP|nr:unnamed protein product [Danaus chrysippus]